MKAKIQLTKSLLISDFPSGSSINYRDGKFYVIGDDSSNILILDADYNKIDSVRLFDFAEKRIPKADKIDLEGSAILEIDGRDHLLIVGSASRKNRKRIILIPFSGAGLDVKTLDHAVIKTKDFIKRIRSNGIEEINLEGVSLFHNDIILANRGNRTNPNNHLIITDKDFWTRQDQAKLLIVKLMLPDKDHLKVLGLSELCYIESLDILFVTLTSEATDNAYDDGAIGNSFIGWITHASHKLQSPELTLENIVDLTAVDDLFKNEKIEGICPEVITPGELTLHLVSDNDAGESRLFKIKMVLK